MAATATGVLKIGVPAPAPAPAPAPLKAKSGRHPTNFASLTMRYPNYFLNTRMKFPAVRALGQGGNPSGDDDNDAGGFINQEDVEFLLKLGAGSIAGAFGIKYGSIIFPEITKPNIVQALIMISAPVVVAIWLLIKQSREETQS